MEEIISTSNDAGEIGFSCEEETIPLSHNSHKIKSKWLKDLDIISEKMTHASCADHDPLVLPGGPFQALLLAHLQSFVTPSTNSQNFSVAGT